MKTTKTKNVINKKKTSSSSKKSMYSGSERDEILNRLGGVSSETKKKIKKDSKVGVTSFQDEKKVKREIGRNTNDIILNYEIDPNDNIFVQTIINIINERQINSKWIYDRIFKLYKDEFPTYEKARSTGYNYLYGLTVKKELGLDRFSRWLKILNVEDFEITYKLGEMEEE